MRFVFTLHFVFILFLPSYAQFGLRHNPLPGYESRLKLYIDSLEIVDTHEHLLNPVDIKNSSICNFMLLYHHFAHHDIISSGMSPAEFWSVVNDRVSPREKWIRLKPYIDNSFNTTFNRIANLAASELFGVEKINEFTVATLSEKIQKAYQGDWLRKVLVDKGKIAFVIQDMQDRSYGIEERFKYLNRFDDFIYVNSKEDVEKLKTSAFTKIETIDNWVNLLNSKFYEYMSRDVVGIKIQLAYQRSLYFEDVKKDKAKRIFSEILNTKEGDTLSSSHIKPFQDYMLHRVLDLVRDCHLPVQIHTGLQSGNINAIGNSNPTLLTNLFTQYPTIKFILLHGSYPYGGELATLAKSLPNVYIDLCWLYAISPTYSKNYLSEWLETIPANKIMAFGGDYHNVENVYAELQVAKEVILEVLVNKVREGYFDEDEARQIARMLLYDNAVKIYNLKGKTPLHRVTQIPGN